MLVATTQQLKSLSYPILRRKSLFSLRFWLFLLRLDRHRQVSNVSFILRRCWRGRRLLFSRFGCTSSGLDSLCSTVGASSSSLSMLIGAGFDFDGILSGPFSSPIGTWFASSTIGGFSEFVAVAFASAGVSWSFDCLLEEDSVVAAAVS